MFDAYLEELPTSDILGARCLLAMAKATFTALFSSLPASKVEDFRDLLPAGTRVYIAHIEGTPIEDMVRTAKHIAGQGYNVMTHFPATVGLYTTKYVPSRRSTTFARNFVPFARMRTWKASPPALALVSICDDGQAAYSVSDGFSSSHAHAIMSVSHTNATHVP